MRLSEPLNTCTSTLYKNRVKPYKILQSIYLRDYVLTKQIRSKMYDIICEMSIRYTVHV